MRHLREERLGAGPEGAGDGPRLHTGGDEEVVGWSGAASLVGGATLQVRLLPLHGVASRQAFERDALERRFALGEGEPWQLELSFRCSSKDGAEEPSPSELSLAGLAVEEEGRPLLRPLLEAAKGGVRSPRQEEGGAADPVVTLLDAPRSLPCDHRVRLVLWGRAPTGEPKLILPDAEGSPAVSLAGAPLAAARVPSILARLDREGER